MNSNVIVRLDVFQLGKGGRERKRERVKKKERERERKEFKNDTEILFVSFRIDRMFIFFAVNKNVVLDIRLDDYSIN